MVQLVQELNRYLFRPVSMSIYRKAILVKRYILNTSSAGTAHTSRAFLLFVNSLKSKHALRRMSAHLEQGALMRQLDIW